VKEWNEPSGLKQSHPICTCGDPSKVVPDLERVAKFLKSESSLSEHTEKINNTLRRIKKKEISIQNISENCGGG
jgi:hypothetical protein